MKGQNFFQTSINTYGQIKQIENIINKIKENLN